MNIHKSVMDLTVREVSAILFLGIKNPKKKTICPCCMRPINSYTLNLVAVDITVLLKIYTLSRVSRKVWINVNQRIKPTSRPFSNAQRWKLIKPKEITGKNKGLWRITKKGIKFLRGEITIPKVLIMYNREIIAIDDSIMVDVHDVYKEKFDLADAYAKIKVPLFKYPSKKSVLK
ncbi:MAG: hypothetical protein GY797_36270 [Deltaproteobacteria bacterium]|nr:hypothetical protein [Deltaproteobacteria bacterium]